jgi:hypothetical protein
MPTRDRCSRRATVSTHMNAKLICFTAGVGSLVLGGLALSQSITPHTTGNPGPQYSTQGDLASAQPAPQGSAVSYASMTQLNGLLAQLEATSKSTQDDLSKLRIERWKTDGSTKKQSLNDVILSSAICRARLPEMIAQLRNAPEDMPATFQAVPESGCACMTCWGRGRIDGSVWTEGRFSVAGERSE